METSEKVPIFAWIEREGGLPVPLHNPPYRSGLTDPGLDKKRFVYSLRGG